jgi:putative spermidine/putrescine transport system permease protein
MGERGNAMKETRTWIMLLPAMLVIVILFIIPILYSLLLSLNFFSITSNTAVGFDAYSKVLTSKGFLDSLIFSLKIASVSTVVSIVIAIAVSMVLRKTFIGRRLALFVYQFNIPVPHLVVAISVLLLFTQTGLISRMLFELGLVTSLSSFPLMVFDKDGMGIMIAFVLKFFPFIGIAVLSLLLTTMEDYEHQAATLGANAWQRFVHVLLPMMMPSILFSSILVFAYAFGSYEVPFLLGSTYPKALAILSYQEFTDIDLNSRPAALAIANIITVIVVVMVILAYLQLNSMNRMGAKKREA